MSITIMGDVLSLPENPLVTLPLQAGGTRRRNLVQFTGQSHGAPADMEALARQIMGLNDLPRTEVSIQSDRFPESVDGWYTIIEAQAIVNKVTTIRTIVDWAISARRFRGEHDVTLLGTTRPNVANQSGLFKVGLPNSLDRMFFPRGNNRTSVAQTTDDGHAMNLWDITSAIAGGGARYSQDPADAHHGITRLTMGW